MCTHDYGIVELMRRRVVELDRGRLVRDEAQGAYGYGT
jgi:cell division transport system ATP-binding protein